HQRRICDQQNREGNAHASDPIEKDPQSVHLETNHAKPLISRLTASLFLCPARGNTWSVRFRAAEKPYPRRPPSGTTSNPRRRSYRASPARRNSKFPSRTRSRRAVPPSFSIASASAPASEFPSIRRESRIRPEKPPAPWPCTQTRTCA